MRGKVKKYIALLMGLFMALVCVSGNSSVKSYADDPVAISFNLNSGGAVEYKIGSEGSWTTAGNVAESALGDSATIYLKATPETGKDLDQNTNQQNVRYDNADHYIASEDFAALKSGTFSFAYAKGHPVNITIKFDGAGAAGGSGPDDGKYAVNIEQRVEGKTGSVQIEFFNSSDTSLGTALNLTASAAEAPIPTGATKVKVTYSTVTGLVLNNARLEAYTAKEHGPETDLIDDLRSSEKSYTSVQPIDISKGYEFNFIFSNTMSVSWSYDAEHAAPDQLVQNAKIYLLKTATAGDYENKNQTDWQLEIGKDYYFELVPDPGYQIVSLTINGYTVAPQDSTGVFKFTMSNSNFHFAGIVSPANDKTTIVENGIIGGMDVDGASAVNSGNVWVTETEASEPDANALNVVTDESATAIGTIDLALEQIISKGNGTYWKSAKTETTGPVTIKIDLPASDLESGKTYSIIRKHNGEYEELTATYDKTTEKLEFSTDKFSGYTIIKKTDSSQSSGGGYGGGGYYPYVPEITPVDPTPVDPAPVDSTPAESTPVVVTPVAPAMAEAIGGVVIKDWDDVVTVLETKIAAVSNELVELNITPSNATVPVETFKALAKSNAEGIHLFTGNGTALTFENDENLALQGSINLSCKKTEEPGKKTIEFESYDDLKAKVIMHSVVPKDIEKVDVYFTDKDRERDRINSLVPNEEGRFCFPIDKLGKYELIY